VIIFGRHPSYWRFNKTNFGKRTFFSVIRCHWYLWFSKPLVKDLKWAWTLCLLMETSSVQNAVFWKQKTVDVSEMVAMPVDTPGLGSPWGTEGNSENCRNTGHCRSGSMLLRRPRCGWNTRHSAGVSGGWLRRAGWTVVSCRYGHAGGQRWRRPPGHGSGVRGDTPHYRAETRSLPLRVELRVVSGNVNKSGRDREFNVTVCNGVKVMMVWTCN
jgi:hypothetical protein